MWFIKVSYKQSIIKMVNYILQGDICINNGILVFTVLNISIQNFKRKKQAFPICTKSKG